MEKIILQGGLTKNKNKCYCFSHFGRGAAYTLRMHLPDMNVSQVQAEDPVSRLTNPAMRLSSRHPLPQPKVRQKPPAERSTPLILLHKAKDGQGADYTRTRSRCTKFRKTNQHFLSRSGKSRTASPR